MKQFGADMMFEERDRPADRRRRAPQPTPRTGKATLVDRRDEKTFMASMRSIALPGSRPPLKHDEIGLNSHRALAHCLSMIFSENRFALFRIML
ncbi:hypothetical protein ACVWW1_000806 [Bradyrhizobium sp. JR3.5]